MLTLFKPNINSDLMFKFRYYFILTNKYIELICNFGIHHIAL